MTTLIDVLRVNAFFAVAVFMATYHLLAPWYRSEVGRNIMAFMGCNQMLLALGVLQMLVGGMAPAPWSWFNVLRAAAFAGLGVVVWWRWSLLIRAQRDGRAQEHLPPAR